MPTPANSLQIQANAPSRFAGKAVLIIWAYGLLLVIPVLLAMLVVSVIQFGLWTFLIPFVAICAATYLLPFGFGNAYVTRLVRRFPASQEPVTGFVVQLTFNPRLRWGLRALVEDADDVGFLTVTETSLVFRGDSIDLTVPRAQLKEVRMQSIGLRGLFVYPRLLLSISGLPGVKDLRFADRSAWVLPTARTRTRELYEQLAKDHLPAVKQ